jgi:predicted ATP-binding protein involved in virulence
MRMTALIGPNGTGKTTILNAIQLLFANFSGSTNERIQVLLQKNIRNFMWLSPTEQIRSDFEVSGLFENDRGETYEVVVNKKGTVKSHPDQVAANLNHYCFLARFDQELNQFQLKRQRWDLFRDIFSEVTGYPVEEDDSAFRMTSDAQANALLQKYVGGFKVMKPRETILNRQCSAGEKKVAKCFSTILNKEVQPRIILIDNVTDHIEVSRHLPTVSNLERCFPQSQIIVTCHSVPVQRNLPNRERLLDMRLLHASSVIRQEPWRLRLKDTVLDGLEQVNTLENSKVRETLLKEGNQILQEIESESLVDPAKRVAEFVRETTFLAMILAQTVDTKPKIVSLGQS